MVIDIDFHVVIGVTIVVVLVSPKSTGISIGIGTGIAIAIAIAITMLVVNYRGTATGDRSGVAPSVGRTRQRSDGRHRESARSLASYRRVSHGAGVKTDTARDTRILTPCLSFLHPLEVCAAHSDVCGAPSQQ